jgi:hypothetical protein
VQELTTEAVPWWRMDRAEEAPMRESPGGHGGQLAVCGGASHRRGSGGDVSRAGGWPVKAVNGRRSRWTWKTASGSLRGDAWWPVTSRWSSAWLAMRRRC